MTIKLHAEFAIIDIKGGRKALRDHLVALGDPVRVVLRGTINCPWGHDDGISQEFSIKVDEFYQVERVPQELKG